MVDYMSTLSYNSTGSSTLTPSVLSKTTYWIVFSPWSKKSWSKTKLVSTLTPSCLSLAYPLATLMRGILIDPKVAGNLELEINLPLRSLALHVLLRLKIKEIETQEQAVIGHTLDKPHKSGCVALHSFLTIHSPPSDSPTRSWNSNNNSYLNKKLQLPRQQRKNVERLMGVLILLHLYVNPSS